jgi:hypothetical protein
VLIDISVIFTLQLVSYKKKKKKILAENFEKKILKVKILKNI